MTSLAGVVEEVLKDDLVYVTILRHNSVVMTVQRTVLLIWKLSLVTKIHVQVSRGLISIDKSSNFCDVIFGMTLSR